MATLNLSIVAVEDDGWVSQTDPVPNQPLIDTTFVGDYGADLNSWFRYRNVTIPPGSIINTAVLTLTNDGSSTGSPTFKLRGYAEDNPTNPEDYNDAVARPKTTAQVTEAYAGEANNTTHALPDISAVIQEIIDRPGWASGNALMLSLEDNGSTMSHFEFYAFASGGSGTKAAKLDITYTVPVAAVSLEYLPYPRTREHPLVDDLVCCMSANISYVDGTSAAFSSSVIQHINKGLPGPGRVVSVENGGVFGDALPQFREMLMALGATATITAPTTGKTVRSVVARMCGSVGHVDGTKHEFAAVYDPALGAIAIPGSEWGVAVETEVGALLDMFEAVATSATITG
jgi:hypothetical protein